MSLKIFREITRFISSCRYLCERPFFVFFGYCFSAIGRYDLIAFDKVTQSLKRKVLLRRRQGAREGYSTTEEIEDDVWKRCVEVRASTGYWPISFSVHQSIILPLVPKSELICTTLPGDYYQYQNEEDYLKHYSNFHFAVTHKKGGWDCLRHLEILAAGSIPLIPDVQRIPKGTMCHYPKRQLAEITKHFMRSPDFPSESLSKRLREHLLNYLTVEMMSKYILRSIEGGESAKILFLDKSLKSQPDYLSIMTLMGLKEIFKKKLSVPFEVPYLYTDWNGTTLKLYGRGFSYARKLPVKYRSEYISEVSGDWPDMLKMHDFIIVGNIERNLEFIPALRALPPKKLILLDGQDKPNLRLLKSLTDISSFIFVRELSGF
jgi:hypothetical protein